VNVNQAGSLPPPSGAPPPACLTQPIVVMTAPTSTTNITGLRSCTRGSSFRSDAQIAGTKIERSNSDFACCSVTASPRRGRG
jgi:hypothetical protein